MRMNAGIIMAGQQPDFAQSYGQGYQLGRQNAFKTLAEQYGAKAMEGDKEALNAFASFDPQMGMGLAASRQNMDVQSERLQMARAEAARAAERHALTMSEADRKAQAEKIGRGLATVVPAIQSGNLEAANQQLRTFGMDPVGSIDDARLLVAQYDGAYQAFERVSKMKGGNPDTEAEREIQRIMSIGYSREQAIGVKEGIIGIFTDPVTRETTLINKITGEIIEPTRPGQADMSGGGQPVEEQPAPDAADPELSFGNDIPTGGAEAFGLGGLMRRGANFASDALGLGEVFPNAAEQQRFFKLIEEDLLVDLSQAYGRQPAQALMERIRSLLPQAGTLEGANAARGELEQLQKRFERDLAVAEGSLNARGNRRMTPQERNDLSAQVNGLKSTLKTIREAQIRLGGGDGGAQDDDALIGKYLKQ